MSPVNWLETLEKMMCLSKTSLFKLLNWFLWFLKLLMTYTYSVFEVCKTIYDVEKINAKL